MRKLLLSFMALFLAFGTSMAQDDKTEFGLKNMSPGNGAMVTAVNNIYLGFTKNVSATLPEGGIEIINTETKEVAVKIDRIYEDEWAAKDAVVFMFEQKLGIGKDGKEEMIDQYIETPGTYSYTIPTGCIKSVDGEEFAGGTFTFTVIGTFPITNYSPVETTDSIKEIVLTFDKEVTAVNLPKEYPLTVCDLNNYWAAVATVKDATVSEDKKNVTLVLSDTLTIGEYTLSIPQGVIVTADGINNYSDLSFRVIDPNPGFFTNYQDGEEVKELGNVFEITFKNVEKVKLKQTTMSVYPPGGADVEGTAVFADNKITVTFDATFTENGEYVFQIPAGMFTMDGADNEYREITVTLSKVEITPLEYFVTPEFGEVGSLEKIVINFNQRVRLYYDETGATYSTEIDLICGDKTYTLTWNSENYSDTQIEYLANAVYENNQFTTTPITEPGTYTLDLSDVFVFYAAEMITDEWGTYVGAYNAHTNLEGIYSWTVTGETAVEKIEVAAGEQVIYDLLGRRIEKITSAGIYIVNGKKVVIK